MSITSFWSVAPSYVSQAPGNLSASAADLAKNPSELDPDVFRRWTRAQQVSYIDAKGAGTPKSLEIGPLGSSVTFEIAAAKTLLLQARLRDNSAGAEFTPDPAGRAATAAELALSPASLPATTFLEWRREDQLAYLSARSGRQTFFGADGQIAFYGEAVPDVVVKAGVIQFTAGDFEPRPYEHLSGSASGTPSAVIKASADALFPDINGTSAILAVEDRPPEFYTSITNSSTDAQKAAFLASFKTWHSGHQLEYVKLYGTGGSTLDISLTDGTRMTAVVSSVDPRKLLILQDLDKAGFAKLTEAEQIQLAGAPGFSTVAAKLGLSLASAATVKSVTDSSSQTATGAVNQLISYINTKATTNKDDVVLATQLLGDNINPNNDPAQLTQAERDQGIAWVEVGSFFGFHRWNKVQRYMPESDREAFTRQLDVLNKQIAEMGLVSPKDINSKLTELKERFDRAFAFFDIKSPSESSEAMGIPNQSVTVYRDVVSNDNNVTIANGYAIFIQQETRIAEILESRFEIAKQGSLFGKQLDVPSLVYQFQSLYNLQLEAQVVMETEEINQQNALLKTYAAMQDAINSTLALFEKAGEGKMRIFGRGPDAYASMTTEERKLLSMFEDQLGTGQKHPLETLRNIKRPLGEIFLQKSGENDNYDIAERSHNQWNIFGTQLSETVTIINQNSQIKMNDVNSMDKQRNRHFELANTALSKLSEMVQNIARIG